MVKRNDHDEAQTTAGAASYLQTDMHCCSCCGIFFVDNNFAQVCRISPDVAIYTRYLAIPPDYLFRMLNIQPKPWLLSVTGLADFDLVDGV